MVFAAPGAGTSAVSARSGHPRGESPDDLDPTRLHLRDDVRPAINQSMATLAELIEADHRR